MIIALLVSLISCDRIKRKSDSTVDKVEKSATNAIEIIDNKKDQIVDRVFPTYDYDKPDTDNNRKRFKEHLLAELPIDVKNIYAYGDFVGADYKVLIAFTCNEGTIEKIKAAKKMQLTTSEKDDGLYFLTEFEWWDKNKIELLQPYKVGKEGEHWQYLWYDSKTGQAFYEEFSL